MSTAFDLLDHVPVGIAVCGNDFGIRFWNACIEDWTGIGREEIVGKPLESFFPRFAADRYRSRLSLLLEGGPPVIFSYQLNGCLFPHRDPKRLERVQHVTATNFPDGCGKRLIMIAVEDRTEVSKRIRAARAELAKRMQAELVLRKSVEEKEFLMRELNHRVKNNLNMIVSLIGLQKDTAGSDTLRPVLDDLESRVRSFAALHEAMHNQAAGTAIPADEYIRSVVGELFASLVPSNTKAKLEIETDPLALPYRDALYLGLIASETVTNAIKYGLDRSGTGTVRVSLRTAGSGYALSVEDDGPGFAAGVPFSDCEDSLGLNLVRLFAEELGGKAAFETCAGARIVVSVNTGT